MQLNHKTFGQGPPLLILHGLFGTLDNWQTLGKRWAEQYTVVLIDQRNHGRSPHLDAHSYPLMAEDLKAFMEANWMYEATLLGHSMGGKTVMQLATHYPDMVEKMVVVDIGPKPYPGGHETIIQALNELPLEQINDRKEADAFLAERIADFGVRQFLLKNLTREKSGGYRWKMNLPVLTRDYQTILENIEAEETYDGPSLFVRGAKSNYIQDGDLETIKESFPAANLVTIPDAGHWVHAEQPQALFDAVSTFLAE
ncbi:MAG: alpha/beta fold hydrolase [Bacteroidota bacterium]